MENKSGNDGVWFKPQTGNALAIAAGLVFFLMCMGLPMVGPAGSRVEHAAANQMAFLGVLFATLALAGAATYSKLGLRKIEPAPLPWFSLGLCGVCVLSLIVLLAGGFAI